MLDNGVESCVGSHRIHVKKTSGTGSQSQSASFFWKHYRSRGQRFESALLRGKSMANFVCYSCRWRQSNFMEQRLRWEASQEIFHILWSPNSSYLFIYFFFIFYFLLTKAHTDPIPDVDDLVMTAESNSIGSNKNHKTQPSSSSSS